MRKELAEAIVEACKRELGGTTLYENYSGRGMYGNTTTGVSCEYGLPSILAVCLANADLFEPFAGEVETLSVDSLGRGIIIY